MNTTNAAVQARYSQNIPHPFSEPPPSARETLPKLNKILAPLDKLRERQNQLGLEAARKRETVPQAQQRDRVARANAAEAGRPSPQSEVEHLEADIKQLTEQADALIDRINTEQERAKTAITSEHDRFTKTVDRRITEDAAAYFAAIRQTEQIRARLAEKLHAKTWLAFHPDAGPQADTHHVPNDPLLDNLPKRTSSHMFADLYRDAEHLPTVTGVPVDTRRALALYNHGAGFPAAGGERRRWIR